MGTVLNSVVKKGQLLSNPVSKESVAYANILLAWGLQGKGSVLLCEREEGDD